MKKIISITLALAMMALAPIVLTGCARDAKSADLVGKWEVQSYVNHMGNDITSTWKDTIYTFNEDGTASRQRPGSSALTGTWELGNNGKDLWVKVGNLTQHELFPTVKIQGDTLRLSGGLSRDHLVVLKKLPA